MAIRGITIHEILNALGCKSRPNANGEYKCHCPAHDDKQESLSVNEGDKGIMLKCHAGCDFSSICAKLGMKERDLFWDDNPRPSSGKPKAAKAPVAPKPKKDEPPKEYMSYNAAFGHAGRIENIYRYTDAQGQLIFSAVRIMPPKGSKTFRQCRPAHPEKGEFPIVCNVPREISDGLVYRLPAVKAAIQAGETVYVVEGEKDADTLARLGRCGTTCARGADSWTQAHGEQLRGADVIVIPDNDDSGKKHEESVLRSLAGVAKRVRVAHLKDSYPELKEKGDITDLCEAIGDTAALEILDDLAEKALDPAVQLYQQAIGAFNAMGGYCVRDGCICQQQEDTSKMLCTFVALPVEEVTKDDGVHIEKALRICGWNRAGRPMSTQMVDVSKYSGMAWAMDGWGLEANIMPGTTVKDKLRSVIQAAGAQVATKKVVYMHSGWRKIEGKWCYLYQGGCVGAEAMDVQLGPGLENYGLDHIDEGIDLVDATLTSWSLANICSPRVGLPMLGVTYLAPLMEFLDRAGYAPSFITMLKGPSGTRKTSTAMLFSNHYGTFSYSQAPASFNDTRNAVSRKAFYLKDMPMVVDDYYPPMTRDEKRKMQAIAQQLSRAFGNHQNRGRLGADLSLQTNDPPRALAIMTGELVPDIGPSGVGRLYIIEVDRDDVRDTEDFMDIWKRARRGELRKAMRGYIEWLAPQADGLKDALGTMFEDYRRRATTALRESGTHSRTPNAVAHIMIGLTMMLRYMESLGVNSAEGTADLLEDYWQVITGNSVQQAEETLQDSPVEMFLAAVRELLDSRAITVKDISIGSKDSGSWKDMAGYVDQNNYYLMADTVYGRVVQFYGDQERMFPLNKAELLRQMKVQGLLIPDGSGKSTKVKRISGAKNTRYLWIPRWVIEGGSAPEPDATQGKMEFKEVDDEDQPESFKD